MRKEYILTEEEKLQKRRKIEENRSRKMSITSEDAGPSQRWVDTLVARFLIIILTSISSKIIQGYGWLLLNSIR